MKKSIALAILASVAGAAAAQSSVTVYGLLDAGITSEIGGASGSIVKLATGVQSGNRLGFKGTEDLGNGLKANFQIENGFNADTGTARQGGALFGRQAYVGLSGNFGALNLGRQYDPLFVALDTIDPFGTGLTGASTNLMSAGNVRTNNAIKYTSNNLSGFTADVLYGAGESANGASVGRTIGASGTYANGPVLFTVAYDKVNANVAVAQPELKLVLVGGTYNFGVAMAHAAYESEKGNGSDFRDYMLGVSVPVGAAGSLMASYINKDDRTANQTGGKQYAIGYTYALSKRTNAYTSYGHIKNDAAGTNFVGDASSGGSTPTAGHSSGALTVGIRHKF
jgi:predicted porin